MYNLIYKKIVFYLYIFRDIYILFTVLARQYHLDDAHYHQIYRVYRHQ